ncbi:AGAP003867-PA [Anopheles gambiae str. PEST]|uniref:Mediator of RNA polymerase II transcription subunit 28 n=2 Tax=gambiae species complex TaxID=44542 RepID=Q7PS84_ANOGA|nr:mediator of RNA polymerase II transcription subunit 28 [Anopheles coluzzii]XP_310426.4 mediator of RNA polymerase II transcription subunit 28 isoform X2 [Anopheles gambiae]EAA06018.5 AGAP003867-PA [Anopheles gambiae str. PEST]
MASSSNVGSGNLVDELEEAFQSCIHALTKEESATGIDKDEIKVEVDQTTLKFIDLARQMEAFFLQKRFLLSALKPDLLLKEENFDLKQEIGRKDELIRKHYEKIESWKQLLSDQQNFNKPIQSMPPDMRGNLAGGAPGGGPAGMMASGGMNLPMQMQSQHQQQQMQQMQVQQQQMQQQMQQSMPMGASNAQMFQQGGIPRGVGQAGGGPGFPPGAGPNLQGPLAYLEKTASNIDLVGLGDGRR